MTYTDAVIDAVTSRSEMLSGDELRVVQSAFLDTLGVALAGSSTEVVKAVRSTLRADASGSLLLGSVDRGAVGDAAFHNAVSAHVLDFDDMTDAIRGHLSGVLIPALLAVIGQHDENAFRAGSAYRIGFQVAASLAAGVEVRGHYRHGWHSTSTIGGIAACASIGHLLDVDADTVRNAIGIAASSASGLRQNFGSGTKPLHAGFAAASAVRAHQLAAAGVSADRDSLGGTHGYLNVFAQSIDLAAAAGVLDGPNALIQPGVNIKLFPCCFELQRAVHAAMAVAGRSERVLRASLTLNVGALEPLRLEYPRTVAESQFSPQFVVASALLAGTLSLDDFSLDRIEHRQVKDLAARIDVREAETAPFGPENQRKAYACLEVEFVNGGVVRERVDVPPGHAARPASHDRLADKLRHCLAWAGMEPDIVDLDRALSTLLVSGTAEDLWQSLDMYAPSQTQDQSRGSG